jgi:hypothetical protein
MLARNSIQVELAQKSLYCTGHGGWDVSSQQRVTVPGFHNICQRQKAAVPYSRTVGKLQLN